MKIYTQRDKADDEVEKIKSVLKSSKLDYFIQESPYSLSIQIRKTFIQDFSPRLEPTIVSTSSTPLPAKLERLSPHANPFLPPSPGSGHDDTMKTNNSSGIYSQQLDSCLSCDDNSEKLAEVINNLEKEKATTLEYEKKNKVLQSEIVRLKSDIQKKAEELKQNKKNHESLKSKLENLANEKDILQENFNNKLHSLEKQNKHLSEKVEEAKQEAKNERKKKKTEEKNAKSNKCVQTNDTLCLSLHENYSKETQTIATHTQHYFSSFDIESGEYPWIDSKD